MPASGPRSTAGIGSPRAAFAYTAPNSGAVRDVQREPDRIRRRPVGDEPPEQLDVVVFDAEHALVEWLLGGPDGRGGGAGEGASEGAGAVDGHRATVTPRRAPVYGIGEEESPTMDNAPHPASPIAEKARAA